MNNTNGKGQIFLKLYEIIWFIWAIFWTLGAILVLIDPSSEEPLWAVILMIILFVLIPFLPIYFIEWKIKEEIPEKMKIKKKELTILIGAAGVIILTVLILNLIIIPIFEEILTPPIYVHNRTAPLEDTVPEDILPQNIAGESLTNSSFFNVNETSFEIYLFGMDFVDINARGVKGEYGDGKIIIEIVKTKSDKDATYLVEKVEKDIENEPNYFMSSYIDEDKAWVSFSTNYKSGFAWRKSIWYFFVYVVGDDRTEMEEIRNKVIDEFGY